jgi:hypothetical protein
MRRSTRLRTNMQRASRNMLYGSSAARVDQSQAFVKARDEATRIRQEIKDGDATLSRAVDRDPCDQFGNMQKAVSWQQQRYRLVGRLTELERSIQWAEPDNSWRPAPSTYFSGSDGA